MTTQRALDNLVAHVTSCDTCRTILDYAEHPHSLCAHGETWFALLVSYRLIEQYEAKLPATPNQRLTGA